MTAWSMVLPEGCRSIMARIRENGGESYIVGGAVRDAILGLSPGDFDITTSLLPNEIEALFDDCRLIVTGKSFGTVGVLVDGDVYEVTTFRADGAYSDKRRPDHVTFTGRLTEDLARRDFTVNAMAWSPESGLVDPFGGAEDLKKRLLRTVGDPAVHFGEDALRIMRLLRFASKLGFMMDQDALLAARRGADGLRAISGERLSAELEKLLVGKDAWAVLQSGRDILSIFMGELSLPMRLTGVYSADLALLLSEQTQQALETLLQRLHVSRCVRQTALYVHAHLAWPLADDRAAIKRLLAEADAEAVRCLLLAKAAMGERDRTADWREIMAHNEVISLAELAINGNDARQILGTCGAGTGRLLKALLLAVIDGKVENRRESLFDHARVWMAENPLPECEFSKK